MLGIAAVLAARIIPGIQATGLARPQPTSR